MYVCTHVNLNMNMLNITVNLSFYFFATRNSSSQLKAEYLRYNGSGGVVKNDIYDSLFSEPEWTISTITRDRSRQSIFV